MIADPLPNFKIETTNKKITAHAGLTLVSEAFIAFGLKKDINELLPRSGSNRGYKPQEFIEPLILTLAGGGQHLEDIRMIENDKSLLESLEIKKIPSSDALGDWLRRMGENDDSLGLNRLGIVNERFAQRMLKEEETTEYTLDIDATGIEAEKFDAKMSYKGYKGYMPFLGFLAENGLCIYDEFREGNESPAVRNLEALRSSIKKMPNEKKIKRFRSDSAGYQAEVINECEKEGIIFSITADMDSAVKSVIGTIKPKKWEILRDTDGRNMGREVAEAIHCMNKTKKSFRLIVQRWKKSKNDNYQQGNIFEDDIEFGDYGYYVIATNSADKANDVVLWHNGRGNSENYNKEVKVGFGMEYMPCGEFKANAVFFRIGIIAYNLIIAIKRNLLPVAWHTKTIATIRWQFLQIAGLLVKHGRRMILKVAGVTSEILMMWNAAREKLRLYANTV